MLRSRSLRNPNEYYFFAVSRAFHSQSDFFVSDIWVWMKMGETVRCRGDGKFIIYEISYIQGIKSLCFEDLSFYNLLHNIFLFLNCNIEEFVPNLLHLLHPNTYFNWSVTNHSWIVSHECIVIVSLVQKMLLSQKVLNTCI